MDVKAKKLQSHGVTQWGPQRAERARNGGFTIIHFSLTPLVDAEEIINQGPVAAPMLNPSGGLRVQNQGAGTANTAVSSYLFAPFGQQDNGSLAYLVF